jgi:hypothetical protein
MPDVAALSLPPSLPPSLPRNNKSQAASPTTLPRSALIPLLLVTAHCLLNLSRDKGSRLPRGGPRRMAVTSMPRTSWWVLACGSARDRGTTGSAHLLPIPFLHCHGSQCVSAPVVDVSLAIFECWRHCHGCGISSLFCTFGFQRWSRKNVV